MPSSEALAAEHAADAAERAVEAAQAAEAMATVAAAEIIHEAVQEIAEVQGEQQWHDARLSGLETSLSDLRQMVEQVASRLAELTPPPSEPSTPISEEPEATILEPETVVIVEPDPSLSAVEESPALEQAPARKGVRWV